MRWNTTTRYPIEVQFEDIDGGGVVHHPNYLRYLERARCQAMREIGVPFEACLKDGVAFVVAEVHSKYLAPLLLGTRVVVETRLVAVRKSSLKVLQKIVRAEGIADRTLPDEHFLKSDKDTFYVAQLRLVAVDLRTGKPITMPESLRVAGGVPAAEEMSARPDLTDVRLLPFSDV